MSNSTSEMPLKLTLINSSPRLWGGTVIADFTVNREPGQYRVNCLLKGYQEKDCRCDFASSPRPFDGKEGRPGGVGDEWPGDKASVL